MRFLLTISLLLANIAISFANDVSIAGMFPIANTDRQVWNFNLGWKFHRGDVSGAEAVNYDDRAWETVSTPHSVMLTPAEDSGCRNYQGKAWYRKSFTVPAGDVCIHFEAIMGKQQFFVNGRLVKEHEGGYLPVNINLAECGLKQGDKAVIAVMTDNSDNKTYPPGKTQMTLDFCYHGGIYRDVWLISKPSVRISDNIDRGEVASGGIFVHYANISERSAEVYVNTDVENILPTAQTVTVENTLTDATGKKLKTWRTKALIPAHSHKMVMQGSAISRPHLWSPEDPYLYNITTKVIASSARTTDGGMTKIGIRSFEFRGLGSLSPNGERTGERGPGFWLNGKRYRQFVGANRHQDFAYVGNAMPNSQQRRDVQRLKDAGFNIIRTAHYPQDPAFMDACDELGIFIIVATPGWQFWNKKEPTFAEKVHQNTRDIIRRDRNHPCVLMWEPILNETRYPEDFALQALQITKDEYPYPYRPVAAADMHSAGVLSNYEVIYGWPGEDEDAAIVAKIDSAYQGKGVGVLTREFGEYVDDWYAHNNLNRASRSWGEVPMLKQAISLAETTTDMYRTTGLFLGGCQWHPFDHQRGYHPDPYWGGAYDAFRQPKYAKEMFAAANTTEPMVFIAHEMTQFSPSDVTVFSNCDSVRLSIYDGEMSWTVPVNHNAIHTGWSNNPAELPVGLMAHHQAADKMPGGVAVFPDVWNFWKAREYSYKGRNWQKVNMVAEGIKDGQVVTCEHKMPSRRSTKLRLYADERDRKLVADGSDFIVVVCEVTDDSGNVRRMAKDQIHFTVEGPAEIIGDGTDIGANPRQVEWGTAPILLRAGTEPGKIHIHADVLYPGTHAPTPADLTIESIAPVLRPLGGETASSAQTSTQRTPQRNSTGTISEAEKQQMLKEVQDQQADFGVGK